MAFIKIYRGYFTTAAIIWTACLVLFLLIYMFVLGPQRLTKKRLESTLTKKQQAYKSAIRAAQEEVKTQLSETIERLHDRLRDFVIDLEDSANLTFDISQIASDKNVASFSIKSKDHREISAIPNCDYICENRIDIGFNSGFNQFAAFLNALERHRPVLFIDGFTMGISAQDDSSYQVDLDVAALVRKQQDS